MDVVKLLLAKIMCDFKTVEVSYGQLSKQVLYFDGKGKLQLKVC